MSSHDRTAVTAFVALGANLGDRRASLESSLDLLRQTPCIAVVRVSTFLKNPAVGMADDTPDFLNGVVQLETTLAAHPLLKRLHEIEQELGRTRIEKWTSRKIDLDLILYGNKVLSSDTLVVPHPLMHERRFVLEPLAEIAPDAVHPTLQMTVSGLLEELNSNRTRSK